MKANTLRTARTRALTLFAIVMLTGCALSEPMLRPQMDLPAQWDSATAVADDSQAALSASWWHSFASPQLDTLIAEAHAQAPELRMQAERVIQAELALRSAGASLLPSLALSGSSGAQNRDGSETRSTGLNLAASYELDLWGRLAATRDSAAAGLQASRFDYDAARLSLSAAVANAWFLQLALDERTVIAQRNLDIAERVLRVVDARYRNGAASALDLSQQRSTVLAQRATLETLRLQQRQAGFALALLRGRAPQDNPLADETLAALQVPDIAPGLPSALLLRRPDLAAGEASLAAAAANVAAARAALLPAFSLSAGGGVASASLFSLADPTHTLSLTASVLQTIFDGGRLAAQADIQRSRQRELVENQRRAILLALKEVEDALSQAERDRRQETMQREIRAEAERSLRLAELRYREGADSLLVVLDAQRSLFAAEDQLAQLRLSRLSAAVALYKALGGGWAPEYPDEAVGSARGTGDDGES